MSQREADELGHALREHRQQQSVLIDAVAQADAVAQRRSNWLTAERRKEEELENETAEEQWLAQQSRTGKR